LLYSVVASVRPWVTAASPVWIEPAIPGGKPVTAASAPRFPTTTVAPVLVTEVPARTLKLTGGEGAGVGAAIETVADIRMRTSAAARTTTRVVKVIGISYLFFGYLLSRFLGSNKVQKL
jgi:hypothetical protein